jgi:hypothetical protein
LRTLIAKARAGEFSLGPMLMALLRGRAAGAARERKRAVWVGRGAEQLAADLSRRAQKLRVEGAAGVVALLVAEDRVPAARAAKIVRLSDRAARRLENEGLL